MQKYLLLTTKESLPMNTPAKAVEAEEITIQTPDGTVIPLFYADRVLNFGIGSGISRLTIGNEVSKNNYVVTAQIVLPTDAFFDAIDTIYGNIENNAELKAGLIQALDKLKGRIERVN